jgi:hypothetical protein
LKRYFLLRLCLEYKKYQKKQSNESYEIQKKEFLQILSVNEISEWLGKLKMT